MNENEIKIIYKKSPIKRGKEKTLLFEVVTSWDKNSVFFFTDRSRYKEIKYNPAVAIDIVASIGNLSKVIERSLTTPTNIKVIYKGFLGRKITLNKKSGGL
ncbi:MAG: hypothetical protein ABS939_00680 [Psychrobacillus sp.]